MGDRGEAYRRAVLAARRRRRRQAVRRRRAALAAALLGVVAFGALRLGGSSDSARPAAPAARTAALETASTAAANAPPSASTPASTTPRRPPANARVTIAAVGDTMLGTTPLLPPSPSSYLDAMRPALRAAIAFANLEGTLTDQTAGKCGAGSASCFAFRMPPAYGAYLRRAGFSVVSDANNHSYDFFQAGLDDTVAALDRAGLRHTGRPGEIAVVRSGPLRVAFVAFAPYPTTSSLLDLAAARRLIRRADARADIVVAAMHAGAEGSAALHLTGGEESYLGEDRGDPERFARAAVDAGADLVLGSGPHVLRGMELYRGRLIAYSLGNFAGYGNFSTEGPLGVSCVLRVTLGADGRLRRGRVVPVQMVAKGMPEPDASGAAISLIRQLSTADLGRRAAPIRADGVISP